MCFFNCTIVHILHFLMQVLEENLDWEDVQWSKTGVWIAGKEYTLARVHFLSMNQFVDMFCLQTLQINRKKKRYPCINWIFWILIEVALGYAYVGEIASHFYRCFVEIHGLKYCYTCNGQSLKEMSYREQCLIVLFFWYFLLYQFSFFKRVRILVLLFTPLYTLIGVTALSQSFPETNFWELSLVAHGEIMGCKE